MPINQPAVPPRKNTPKTPAPKPAVQTTEQRLSGRAEAVNGIFQLTTAALLLGRQYADAATVDEHGENISRECAKIAEDNEQFAGLIDKLTTVGPYAGLMTAILPMAMQLAVNHKRIDPGIMGTIDPEVLTAKVQAEIAEKKAKFLAEAAEARAEAEIRLAQAQERQAA